MRIESAFRLKPISSAQVVGFPEPTMEEVASLLFSLKAGKRSRSASESSAETKRQDEEEVPLHPHGDERCSSSSVGSGKVE